MADIFVVKISRLFYLFLILTIICHCSNSVLAASYEINGTEVLYSDGRLLARTNTYLSTPVLDSILDFHGCELVEVLPNSLWCSLAFDTTIAVDSVMADVGSDSLISCVILNRVLEFGGLSDPSDPQFEAQWYLYNDGSDGRKPRADIRAYDAWNIQLGDTNVVVGILDTGLPFDCEGAHPCQTGSLIDWDDFDPSHIILGSNFVPSQTGALPDIVNVGQEFPTPDNHCKSRESR
jgi:hypothetical protein